jgi:U3 small nucleolar RNA-associated protein 10
MLDSSSPHVRFGALRVCAAFFVELGLPFLALLPETVPFVAELMEDENIEVERLTQALIKRIEALSGESMDNYLR